MGKRSPKELCPCCGETKVSSKYGICKVCGWINDPRQKADPDLREGRNPKSLNESKDAYFMKYVGMLDGPPRPAAYYEWEKKKLPEWYPDIFGGLK